MRDIAADKKLCEKLPLLAMRNEDATDDQFWEVMKNGTELTTMMVDALPEYIAWVEQLLAENERLQKLVKYWQGTHDPKHAGFVPTMVSEPVTYNWTPETHEVDKAIEEFKPEEPKP